MNYKFLKGDSFLAGITSGAIFLFLFYFIVDQLRLWIGEIMNSTQFFEAPRPQLVALALNMIFFRMLMIRFDREKTGKGLLFITVMITFVYIYLFGVHRN